MRDIGQRLKTGVLAGVLFFGSYFFYLPAFMLLLSMIFIYILLKEWPPLAGYKTNEILFWVISLLYPIAPFGILLYVIWEYHTIYPIIAALIIDSGAYFFGNIIGHRKFASHISPNKTWEGVAGGLFCLFGYHLFLQRFYNLRISWELLSAATLLVGVIAISGDLFISLLKRRADIKDTGGLLPGHGGLLDRFDSILFIAMTFLAVEMVRYFF